MTEQAIDVARLNETVREEALQVQAAVNEMKKVYKLGVHTFYRPRAWGDGDDEPTWGDAAATEKEAAAEEAKGPVSHSIEWLRSEEGRASGRQSARK